MKNNKILVYVILVQIISIIIILLSYGIVYDNKYQTHSEEESEKTFEVIMPINYYRPSVDMSVIKEAFPEVLSDYEDIIDNVFVESYGILDSPLTSEEREEIGIEQGSSMAVDLWSHFDCENGKYKYTTLLEKLSVEMNVNKRGRLFTEDEMNLGNKVCIPCFEIYKLRKNDMCICGEEYGVLGYGECDVAMFLNNTIYIPIESVPDKAQLKEIYIGFNRMLVRSEYEDIKERICSLLGDSRYDIVDYVTIDIDTKATRKTIIIIGVMLAVLSCVTIVLIYRYRLEKKKPQMAIYFICGYSSFRVMRIMLKEVIACIAISGVAGYVIFKYLLIGAVKKYFTWFEVIFAGNEALLMVCLISLVTLVFVLAEMIRFFRKNPYEMWVGKRA